MPLQSIRDITDLRGKTVLVRSSLNAPKDENGNIDDFRLEKGLPTLQYLKNHDAKVIVIGHIGRDAHESLKPVHACLEKFIPITFVPDNRGPHVKNALNNMVNGDIILLENLRREAGEISNDDTFADELASYADIYINDAFSVSHREHASIVGIPKKITGYAGLLFEDEYKELQYARNPEHPALFILGGAKFETKQPLVEKFLTIYDHVFVTGALANDFFMAEGYPIGKSLVSEPPVDVRHLLQNQKVILPQDVTVLTKDGNKKVRELHDIEPDDVINDVGPKTLEVLKPIVAHAQFILWNGPLGDYQQGFEDGTKRLIEMIDKSDAESVVGGGDTMSLISKYGYQKRFSFCSTAGGSMLEFLLKGTLPGIEALKKSPIYE